MCIINCPPLASGFFYLMSINLPPPTCKPTVLAMSATYAYRRWILSPSSLYASRRSPISISRIRGKEGGCVKEWLSGFPPLDRKTDGGSGVGVVCEGGVGDGYTVYRYIPGQRLDTTQTTLLAAGTRRTTAGGGGSVGGGWANGRENGWVRARTCPLGVAGRYACGDPIIWN